jgi:hypothetical protein
MRHRLLVFALLLAAGSALALLGPARGQQILQNGFEGREPLWKHGSTDTASRVLKQELTEQVKWSGQRSEHIQLQVEKGSYLHFTYDLPRAPIGPDLNVGLYLKSNRPGISLLCRIVLPNEKDPQTLKPVTVLVRCEPYESTRWKLVKLRQPVKRLQEQQQLLAHKLGRPITTEGAYISQLVLNLYDGPGLTDVWIDDLEIGPVFEGATPAAPEPAPGGVAAPVERRTAQVALQANQLLVSGKPFLMRGIRYTGTPLKTLRDAGFNVLWLDETTTPRVVKEAVDLGFWLVPSIHPPEPQAAATSPPGRLASRAGEAEGAAARRYEDEFRGKLARFTSQDAVLAWDLGSNLDAEAFGDVTRFSLAFSNADQHQPVIADVYDGYRGYSRSLQQVMLGTHRWPLMTSLELSKYHEWLVTRRRLSVQNYSWTWVQTHVPDWYARLAYPGEGKDGFREPVGPQPEQIRLLSYLALAAGYRGLAFWSDRSLSDSHQGRDRLLALALLNQELQMLEGVLSQSSQDPEWIPTSRGEVMAAVFRTPSGVLVLPIWLGQGSQYVPGQGASAELAITVPGVPVTATAWEVSPGRVRSYPLHRDLGGTTVKLHNFSLTAAVLFTPDLSANGLVVHLQDQQRRIARLAAQWLHDQAQEELAKVERVEAALERQGHGLPDAQPILARAKKALAQCVQHRRNGDHSAAYDQAEVALRALRILMRAHWDKAVRDLDAPASSPYAASFYTLERHWQLLDRLHGMRPTPNVLPGGDFEAAPTQVQAGWVVHEQPSLDPVVAKVRRVSDAPHTGKQCLMMKIEPRDKKLKRPPEVLERTYVTLDSPAVRVRPGTVVRISAWVRMPTPILGSVDGVLIYDSVGGEPLAIRLSAPNPAWKRYTLFREAPASGLVSVTLALSGMGVVYFDDVRIEPLTASGSTAALPARAARTTIGQPRKGVQ